MPLSDETVIIILHGDVDFSSAQRRAIEEAVHEWYEFTKNRFLFHIIYDLHKTDLDAAQTNDLIFNVDSQFHHVQTWDAEHAITALGYCINERTRGTIYIVKDRLDNYLDFKLTIMHELGHYIGLEHTPKGSIMYKNNSPQTKFTELDGIEFCDKYGGSLTDLYYHSIIAW